MEPNLQISWLESGTLEVTSSFLGTFEYAQGKANQLILCARMNPWDRFKAMLEKNTDTAQWTILNAHLTTLDKSAAWKFKEKFARLSTKE
jgi:hypothetical protein